MTREEVEKVRKQKNILCEAKVYVPSKLSTTATFDSYITQVSEFLAQTEIDSLKTMSSSFKSLTDTYNAYLNTIPLSRSTVTVKLETGHSYKKAEIPNMKEAINHATQNLETMTPATKIQRRSDAIDITRTYPSGTVFYLNHVRTVATYDGAQYVNLKNCCDKINSEVKRINDKIKNSKSDSIFSFELFCENS